MAASKQKLYPEVPVGLQIRTGPETISSQPAALSPCQLAFLWSGVGTTSHGFQASLSSGFCWHTTQTLQHVWETTLRCCTISTLLHFMTSLFSLLLSTAGLFMSPVTRLKRTVSTSFSLTHTHPPTSLSLSLSLSEIKSQLFKTSCDGSKSTSIHIFNPLHLSISPSGLC